MFERFTEQAREAVATAQREARDLGHGYIGTEHLLLGLAAPGAGIAAEVLAAQGVTVDGVRTAVVRMIGRGEERSLLSRDDAEALELLGIDLDLVRARVEAEFGPGALDRPPVLERARRRRLLWRRKGTCRHRPAPGYVPLTPRAKTVLELSLREALALHHNWIGTEHLLLGLIREGEGVAARILADETSGLPELRRRLLDRVGRVA